MSLDQQDVVDTTTDHGWVEEVASQSTMAPHRAGSRMYYKGTKRSRGVLLSVVVRLIEVTRTVSLVDAWRKVTLDALDVLGVSGCELLVEIWHLGRVTDGGSEVGPLGTVRNMVHGITEQRTDVTASHVIREALPLIVGPVSPIRFFQSSRLAPHPPG